MGLSSCSQSSPQLTCSALDTRKASAPSAQRTGRRIDVSFFGANAWQAHFAQTGKTILVDPWLVGELTFADQKWLFEGLKGLREELDVDAIAANADLLVLSQGLPDHAHKPTLERLPKDMPVVGSPAAARVVADMGFKNVFELDHGQSMSFCEGALTIQATAGALVGPPWSKRENGFVFTETGPGSTRLYYEPHCDYDEQALASTGITDIDVLITPASSQLVLGYPLVQGSYNIVKLIQQLRPKVVVPLINADFPSKGPLASLIYEKDSHSTLPARLKDANINDVRVQLPAAVAEPTVVDLSR